MQVETKINRIVIFTLETFYSHGAIKKLLNHYRSSVVLVVLSQRYGGKHGSFFKQLKRNWRNSGFGFVEYLSFHFVYYFIFIYCLRWLQIITRRKHRLLSISHLAKELGIQRIKTKNVNAKEVSKAISEVEPDLIISAFFDQIIAKKIFELARYGAINIHPGILPHNRGVLPPLAAEVHGYPQGVTVHYVNEALDEGDILYIKEVAKKKDESLLSLDHRIMRAGAEVAIDIIDQMSKGNIASQTQPRHTGNYHSFPNKADLKKLKQKGIKLFSVKDFIKHLYDRYET